MIPQVYAQVRIDNPNINPAARFSDLSTILNRVIPTVMIGASLVFLFVLLFGAFTYLTSSGEQEKIQKARKTITYSIMGLILIFLSYLFVSLVSIITGIELLI